MLNCSYNTCRIFSTRAWADFQISEDIIAHTPDVSRWGKDKSDKDHRPIPHKYGAKIEAVTNGLVTRQEMFPDEWQGAAIRVLGNITDGIYNGSTIPVITPLSEEMSKELKRRGFKFVGSTIPMLGGRQ